MSHTWMPKTVHTWPLLSTLSDLEIDGLRFSVTIQAQEDRPAIELVAMCGHETAARIGGNRKAIATALARAATAYAASLTDEVTA